MLYTFFKKLWLFMAVVCGFEALKLENWHDPHIEGSIRPEALEDTKRSPKLLFGVTITTH